MMIIPLKMYCMLISKPKNVKQYVMPWKMIVPKTTPEILPIPPEKETPPITQAAIASSSVP